LYPLTSFISITNPWMYAARIFLNVYIQLIITASVLLYYQKVIRK
jgi:hypothetical protein